MTIRKLAAVLIFLSTAALSAQNAPHPAAPPASDDGWKTLQFLIGAWDATANGGAANAQVTGSYIFRPELKGHVLTRQSSSASCKAPDAFDCDHSDLLYIYSDAPGQPYKAIYFDNEGHVLHYAITTPTPTSVVFLTDASQPGPQFRLSYELKDGTMYGKFQGKMPGHADFQSYLEWSGKKR
jgi:hypothetical protein